MHVVYLTPNCLNPYCCGRWSRTGNYQYCHRLSRQVLILIVVEDGLVHKSFKGFAQSVDVLILIVVEDGLVRKKF